MGVRVLTRAMKKVTAIAGTVGATLRDRSRSVNHRLLEIGRIARSKGAQRQDKLTRAYQRLLATTSRVVGQAKRFSREIGAGVKRARDVLHQAALEGLRQELDTFVPRVQQVMRQARARVFGGDTHVEDKLLSLFEPSTEVIRKGKAGKPTEFGKMVKLQEAEHQIITAYVVYDTRPSDSDLLIPALDGARATTWGACRAWSPVTPRSTRARMKRPPTRRASRASAFRTPSTKSAERKREQKKRWFKNGQKWRTGCEGRISVVKRRHGLNRCRYKGADGMKRWVGLGVIADNLINIGRVLAIRAETWRSKRAIAFKD